MFEHFDLICYPVKKFVNNFKYESVIFRPDFKWGHKIYFYVSSRFRSYSMYFLCHPIVLLDVLKLIISLDNLPSGELKFSFVR